MGIFTNSIIIVPFQYGGCDWPNSLCLPQDELYLLQQFNEHLKTSGPFQLVNTQLIALTHFLHIINTRCLFDAHKIADNEGSLNKMFLRFYFRGRIALI